MKALQCTILSSVAVLALCGLFSAKAEAQGGEKYAVVSITNRTNANITYEFRWGLNGEWKLATLTPGETMHHSWTYPYRGYNESPIKHVRFDSDPGPAKLIVTQEVLANASPDKVHGKRYAFVYEDADRDYIALRLVD